MKSKLARLLGAFLLVTGMLLTTAAAPVAATGNCNIAYVTLYEFHDLAGRSRTFCYGSPDSNVSSESPSIYVMGPLNNGQTLDDFDTNATWSGVSSWRFGDTQGSRMLCLYYGLSWDSSRIAAIAYGSSTGNLLTTDDMIRSLYIRTEPATC